MLDPATLAERGRRANVDSNQKREEAQRLLSEADLLDHQVMTDDEWRMSEEWGGADKSITLLDLFKDVWGVWCEELNRLGGWNKKLAGEARYWKQRTLDLEREKEAQRDGA